jgi:hypothetical protein
MALHIRISAALHVRTLGVPCLRFTRVLAGRKSLSFEGLLAGVYVVCITRSPPGTAGGYNAAGAASSISSSAARLPRLSARILLICGLIFWISCLVTLSRLRTCDRRCMLTLSTLRLSAAFARRGSWILSASCPLVPALFLLLCARFLPVMSFWLGRCLRPLSLPPSSRVARRCPPSFRPFGGAEAEAPLG